MHIRVVKERTLNIERKKKGGTYKWKVRQTPSKCIELNTEDREGLVFIYLTYFCIV